MVCSGDLHVYSLRACNLKKVFMIWKSTRPHNSTRWSPRSFRFPQTEYSGCAVCLVMSHFDIQVAYHAQHISSRYLVHYMLYPLIELFHYFLFCCRCWSVYLQDSHVYWLASQAYCYHSVTYNVESHNTSSYFVCTYI